MLMSVIASQNMIAATLRTIFEIEVEAESAAAKSPTKRKQEFYDQLYTNLESSKQATRKAMAEYGIVINDADGSAL